MVYWNPWQDYKESSKNKIKITELFDLPIKQDNNKYIYKSGTKFTVCNMSDFFLPEMKEARKRLWEIIKERSDCKFIIITKYIDLVDFPNDWNDGYDNVEISCIIENQEQMDLKWPIFNKLPIKHKSIHFTPLTGRISLKKLSNIDYIICCGEIGPTDTVKLCREEWVRDLYNQSHELGIPFCFKQIGSKFYTIDNSEILLSEKDQIAIAALMGFQDFPVDS